MNVIITDEFLVLLTVVTIAVTIAGSLIVLAVLLRDR